MMPAGHDLARFLGKEDIVCLGLILCDIRCSVLKSQIPLLRVDAAFYLKDEYSPFNHLLLPHSNIEYVNFHLIL